MAYRYVQEVAPLFSSGLCRPRAFDASQRSLAALAQALVEARPVWPVCEPSVEQLHHRTARRPIFAHPRSGWIGQAFRELVSLIYRGSTQRQHAQLLWHLAATQQLIRSAGLLVRVSNACRMIT